MENSNFSSKNNLSGSNSGSKSKIRKKYNAEISRQKQHKFNTIHILTKIRGHILGQSRYKIPNLSAFELYCCRLYKSTIKSCNKISSIRETEGCG
jgi:hypothetical protein